MNTTSCPVCFGEKGWDNSDLDAYLGEHLTDEQLANVPNHGEGWHVCDECEGTGIVTVERAKDMAAAARAYVDQLVAGIENGDFDKSA